jgi:hypothetical protein
MRINSSHYYERDLYIILILVYVCILTMGFEVGEAVGLLVLRVGSTLVVGLIVVVG